MHRKPTEVHNVLSLYLQLVAQFKSGFFSRNVYSLGGEIALWGEKIRKSSKKRTNFVVVLGGNLKLRGGIGSSVASAHPLALTL